MIMPTTGGLCHQTLFSPFFFSPFQPNFFTFLTLTPFFSHVYLLMIHHTHNKTMRTQYNW